jgi:hypothetical protein
MLIRTCLILVHFVVLFQQKSVAGMDTGDTLKVYATPDFPLNGKGDDAHWARTDWHSLQQIDSGVTGYTTRFKILYSASGIYVLLQGIDKKITTQFTEDCADLFKGDVFEVFFHPKPTTPLYFEYEINALGKELVLMIPNINGKFMGRRPWHYEGNRKVLKQVSVEGGEALPGAAIQSWSAELFIPYALLLPLENVPPTRGMCWKANFCRLDYDTGRMIKWSWSPIQISFHEVRAYRTIEFQ